MRAAKHTERPIQSSTRRFGLRPPLWVLLWIGIGQFGLSVVWRSALNKHAHED
jgi:hypothetical protein